MRKAQSYFIFYLFLVYYSNLTFASQTIDTSFTKSKNYKSFFIEGSKSFGEGDRAEWTPYLGLLHTVTENQNTDVLRNNKSRTNLIFGGTSWASSNYNSYTFEASFWKDSENLITRWSPKVGLEHTFTRTTFEGDEIPKFTVFTFLETNIYNAKVDKDASGFATRRGSFTNAKNSELRFIQLRPSVGIEKTLFNGFWTPSFEAAHYLYSQDPADIERTVSRNSLYLQSSNSQSLNNILGGFLKNELILNTRMQLFKKTSVSLNLARAQFEMDKSWSTSYGASFKQNLFNLVDAKLAWNKTIQSGEGINYYTFGFNFSI